VRAALKFADYRFAILVDDLHDTSSPGLNQNGMLIHISVSVTRHVVLSRHLIVRDALLGQDCPDAKFLLVAIRWYTLAHNVLAETRTIFYAQYPANSTSGGPDSTSYDSAERTSGASAFFGTFLRAAESTLGLRSERQRHQC
jgi:hypothetical protein